MGEELTPSQQAAAFHGLAINRAVPPDERLALALQALGLYEAEVERLRAELAKARRIVEAIDDAALQDPGTVPTVRLAEQVAELTAERDALRTQVEAATTVRARIWADPSRMEPGDAQRCLAEVAATDAEVVRLRDPAVYRAQGYEQAITHLHFRQVADYLSARLTEETTG